MIYSKRRKKNKIPLGIEKNNMIPIERGRQGIVDEESSNC
jgi:hypothetical protein